METTMYWYHGEVSRNYGPLLAVLGDSMVHLLKVLALRELERRVCQNCWSFRVPARNQTPSSLE